MVVPALKLQNQQVTQLQKVTRFYFIGRLILLGAPKNKTAEEIWLQIKHLFPEQDFQVNWRGYEYVRFRFAPFLEILPILFRTPLGDTGIHDHDGLNVNKALVGEFWESKFTIRNGKPRRIKMDKVKQGFSSVCFPFQSHEMTVINPSLTINLHFPCRPEDLTVTEVASVLPGGR